MPTPVLRDIIGNVVIASVPESNKTFFVYIIESPSASDLLEGRTEGKVLLEALRLSDVPVCYNLVTNLETLDRALGNRFKNAINKCHPVPLLHLSLHGNDQGLELTDGHSLGWEKLREMLLQLPVKPMVVCLSACFGLSGCKMALMPKPYPFDYLVGHPDCPAWDDAAVAFVAFYHRIRKGANGSQAVEAMRAASGDERFQIIDSQRLQRDFVADLREQHREPLA